MSKRKDTRDAAEPERAPEPEGVASCVLVHEGREYLVLSAPRPVASLPASLSPAESEVVRLALAGLSNEGIALATNRATRTVANLLARACRKLGVRRRTELAAVVSGTPRPSSDG